MTAVAGALKEMQAIRKKLETKEELIAKMRTMPAATPRRRAARARRAAER